MQRTFVKNVSALKYFRRESYLLSNLQFFFTNFERVVGHFKVTLSDTISLNVLCLHSDYLCNQLHCNLKIRKIKKNQLVFLKKQQQENETLF